MLAWPRVVALALCATACVVPPGEDGPEGDSEVDGAEPEVDVDVDADVELAADVEAAADVELAADVDGACPAYCAAFLPRCDGSLADRDVDGCVASCEAWSAAAVSCREEWLAVGSCIAAGPESPTCLL
ncbi:MAG TPA: hypothetical protein VFG69_21605 [Nannocystaceae bacterium]|nr:hypothetical protein [Nannocystaceae bacterium]